MNAPSLRSLEGGVRMAGPRAPPSRIGEMGAHVQWTRPRSRADEDLIVEQLVTGRLVAAEVEASAAVR